MKVIYCGCKSQMKSEKMVFPRGKPIEVTEKISTKLMAIDGFYKSMNDDAKKELKRNIDREKSEIEKLNGNVKIVEVADPEMKIEIELLKIQLAEATDGTQLASLTVANTELSSQLKDCQAKLQAAELTAKK